MKTDKPKAFVRNRGKVLTRERLLEEVWGAGVYVTDRVVDGNRVHLVLSKLGTAQDEADLRAVAVSDDEIPAGLDQIDEVGGDRGDGVVLIRDLLVRLVAHKCVPAERHDCQTAHDLTRSLATSSSPRARRWRRRSNPSAPS